MFKHTCILFLKYPCCLFPGTFTLDEAIDNMGFGVFQLKITFFTGLCWVSVITGAIEEVWRI